MKAKDTRPIIFIGGIFPDEQIAMIEANSTGLIQYAADALQKNIILGLSESYPGTLSIINLPFVGSYPRAFKRALLPSHKGMIYGVPVFGPAFSTRGIARFFSRFFKVLRELLRGRPRNAVLLIYSANPPLLYASIAFRLLRPRSRLCLILPDLPEFMDEGSRLYRALKSVEAMMFYRAVRLVDGFVLLTRAMAERLDLKPEQFVVVEGIVDRTDARPPRVAGEQRIFLYTGTLAARYGIMDLVAAFRSLRIDGVQLWICGDGDSRGKIEKAAADDARIAFFGQISRQKAVELQNEATVLVNPRRPIGEYTKYSFPSKTLEYMAAGRAVLMHRLAGVPEEYFPYFIHPHSPDVEGLADAMSRMAAMTTEELEILGSAGRAFVLKNKTAAAQAERISNLLASIP